MYIERETMKKMDELSIAIWGSKSAWQNHLKYGIKCPSEKLCNRKNPHPVSTTIEYYTVDTLYTLMQDLLKQMQDSLVKKL